MILPLDRDLLAQWAEHGIPTDPSTLDYARRLVVRLLSEYDALTADLTATSCDHMPIGDVIRAVTADMRQSFAAIRVDQRALLARIEAADARLHDAMRASPTPTITVEPSP